MLERSKSTILKISSGKVRNGLTMQLWRNWCHPAVVGTPKTQKQLDSCQVRRPDSGKYNPTFLTWRLGALVVSCFLGCLNPFAPIVGDTGEQTWSDQSTVGGLLNNFELSYDYRDSLRYADCLSESFVFYYYDVDEGRFDSWFRNDDLKATGSIFHHFKRIDLEWNLIPDDVVIFDYPDSTLQFIVRFNLTIGDEAPLMGYARFSARREQDNRFRFLIWRDDF